MTELGRLLPLAVQAVERASLVMRHRPAGTLTAKGDRDLASQVDFQIERDLRLFLRDETPEIGFLGEEEGVSGSGELQWALDPVDGTVNFVRGLPLCAISLGLIRGRRPVLGVIDLPFLDRRYTAAEGHGAQANGQPIKVSDTASLTEAIVAIGDYAVGPDATSRNRSRLALTALLAAAAQRVRMTGSAALDLAWLAEGKFDAALTLSNHPWDMTAGVVIAREAGAVILDQDGSAHSSDSMATIAATPLLADQVLQLVNLAESAPARSRQARGRNPTD
ncbi:inositol monophosphatase family protein [Solwaraspora sp. WMMD1047]|uniref:inositol monophosphatase family protein n=1 Tax=Solwaraspora sp. WMMD1047 TaxID=3016102 RepID=UPI0024165E5C|nr:inositol monophosphatase family protein [Solwaraspora sp. WMMD1047]MDG4830116.1 inositol monophosphatase family protein [Solwaraspora sp. WMMD1047]